LFTSFSFHSPLLILIYLFFIPVCPVRIPSVLLSSLLVSHHFYSELRAEMCDRISEF
jgi:hypothetical protein